MSRFRGVEVVLPITRKNRNIKALNLYFSAVKSSRARNSKTEGVFDNSYGVACRRSLKLGADRTPGRRSGITAVGRIWKDTLGSETGFVRAFDPAKNIWRPLSTAIFTAPCHPGLESPKTPSVLEFLALELFTAEK